MSKTVIIANRLPIKIERSGGKLKFKESEGGLATGLDSVYHVGNNIWIGWPGTEITDKKEQKFVKTELRKKNLIPLFLSKKEVQLFYQGFANEIIWPICHYRPSYSIFERKSWLFYKKVNKKFSDLVIKHVAEEDFVWVHDYHLMLLPKLLRAVYPKINIAYFQHIPFPSREIFKLIPWRKELIEGVLGADLIGFHISEYVNYFKNACVELAGKKTENNKIIVSDRKVKVDAFPMGIDIKKYKNTSERNQIKSYADKIKTNLQHDKIILSIDRLDYSKGIIERVKAVEHLLQKYDLP